MSGNEWYNKWQRVAVQHLATNVRVTKSGTMNANKWYNEWQQVTTNDARWIKSWITVFSPEIQNTLCKFTS